VVKTFRWHHPALYLVILAGVLIYAIVALIVRKSIKVSVPLCAQHAKRRSIAVTLAWVLPLAGIADIFVLNQLNVDGGVIALVTIVLILAGLVIWVVVANPIVPRFIDQSRGDFYRLLRDVSAAVSRRDAACAFGRAAAASSSAAAAKLVVTEIS
jgi:hypothetical protein